MRVNKGFKETANEMKGTGYKIIVQSVNKISFVFGHFGLKIVKYVRFLGMLSDFGF